MFHSQEDATRQLSDTFERRETEIFTRLLRPHIGFEILHGPTSIGATRMGGTPDLPSGIAWPIREIPKNIDEIVNLGGSNHGEHIRQHLEQALPYAFIAQIDLAQAARLLPDLPLPDHGRLLLFCDLQIVPWRDGIESCRVIWDIAAEATLSNAGTPPVLQRLAAISLEELRVAFKQHGLDTDDLSHSYWGPSRPMRLKVAYALPETGTPEAKDEAEFLALIEDEDICDAYSDFVSEIARDRIEGIERHRMLGYPLPEQDDPRYGAVALIDFAQDRSWEWPDRPDEATIDAHMKRWHLLLQCDLSDYYQDRLSEGTLYFLIRDDDLRARNFERVVVIYQQT